MTETDLFRFLFIDKLHCIIYLQYYVSKQLYQTVEV